MSETQTAPERFTLDEAKAREWLAGLADDRLDPGSEGYDPRDGECMGMTAEFVSDATASDVITGPAQIDFDGVWDSDGPGYYWMLSRGDMAGAFLTSGWQSVHHLGEPGARGADGLLGVLREAVTVANATFGALDVCAAAQPRSVWVLRWSDRHSDETSVHATEASALESLAAVAGQCGDAPDREMTPRQIVAWWAAQPDHDYDLAEYEIER